MIGKSLFAVAALAATMATTLPAAQAKADVDVSIGFGVAPYYGYDRYDGYYDGYRDSGYGYDFRYERHRRHSYEDDGISCREGRMIVIEAGFRDVRPVDCDGPGYRYTARRHGHKFVVRVNEDGDITRVRRVY